VKIELIKEAGLTDGEAKVYLALLKLGTSTAGPIIERSKVANSMIYRILDSLIAKGLVSYITKEKTKQFSAAPPNRIVDYIEERKKHLTEKQEEIKHILPQLIAFAQETEANSVELFEGFKGVQTCWEVQYTKLKKGDEYHSWGVYPNQDERFHLYWQRDHLRRAKLGIKGKILFNQGTDKEILRNRNSYKGCDSRYMPTNIKTPATFATYKDVSLICQLSKPFIVQIVSQDIADSFEAYFQDLWQKTRPFK